MGSQTRKKRGHKKTASFCNIPIQLPVFNSSSANLEIGHDFYGWVNDAWHKEVIIPEFENDFGVSEEVERCIFRESKRILERFKASPTNEEERMYQTLAESCLHSASQHTSVEYLKTILKTLVCIQTPEDVVRHFAILNKSRFSSILNFQYHIETDKTVQLCIDSNTPGLQFSYYGDPKKVKKYKEILKSLGELCDVKDLERIYTFEKSLVYLSDELWSSQKHKCKGITLVRKFPTFPWDTWFNVSGLPDWKHRTLYYTCPRWIRKIARLLHEVPIHYWRTYLARCYILDSIHFLPPPFDELDFDFFGHEAQGQRRKLPQQELFVQIVHDYLQESFSRIFWKETGNETLVSELEGFGKDLLNAGVHRMHSVEWLQPETRKAAMEKIKAMRLECVRPTHWTPFKPIELDSKNLLNNIFLLGEANTKSLLERIGKPYRYWEEGIYRVNAYYFSENNELMIPYGTVLPPFYSLDADPAWNFGALGSIIGHEMCHGFDEDGKDYNPQGEKKSWWSRSDRIHYRAISKKLIELFSKQKVEGVSVNGTSTLSENIADLGGVGISLQALKDHLKKEGVESPEKLKEAYRHFFIAYATSWRTKVRKEKQKTSLGVDVHSPAFLRVNLIVSQFDEWYEAFSISSDSELYRKPEERIRIF